MRGGERLFLNTDALQWHTQVDGSAESDTRPSASSVHLEDFAGWTAGVDGTAWLHQCGVFFSVDIHNQRYDGITQHIIGRCKTLRAIGINLLLVFDGEPFKGKQEVDEARANRRAKALQEAEDVQDDGVLMGLA